MRTLGQKAEIALRMVREAPLLVVDTETSGLDWKRNYAVGYVFTVGADSVYVPIRHGGGGNLPDPSGQCAFYETAQLENSANVTNHRFELELAEAFRQRTEKTVGHNLKFDAHFFAQRGIVLGRNLSCTQNNQCLVDEYTRSYSLDNLGKLYGLTAKRSEEMYEHIAVTLGVPNNREAMGHFWRLSGLDDVATAYAEGDGITTWELYHAQQAELDKQGVRDEVRRVEDELIWTLVRMERRGMKIDIEYATQLQGWIAERVAEAFAQLPPGFNVRSPIHVRDWMTQHGHTDWPKTAKGNPSFDEKFLMRSEAGRKIVDIRKWSNLDNTFITPLIKDHTFMGRVHANLNQNKADDYGTISGRLSCSNPNLQQVPKHNKEIARKFRPAFVADEGYTFYEGDYSQCEPRLFAHYSGEPALVEGYSRAPFRDVHTVVAELFNADRSTVAKRMNMGMFTGMQAASFSGHMGLSLSEATRLWNQWFEFFPNIRKFQNSAKTALLDRGYVRTLLGRHCRLERRDFAYKATSKIIQGSNADIIKYKMVEVDKWLEENGDRTLLMMSVHDSFVWQAPDSPEGVEDSKQIVAIMSEVQSAPFNLKVPFTVDCHSGRNWAEASFGK